MRIKITRCGGDRPRKCRVCCLPVAVRCLLIDAARGGTSGRRGVTLQREVVAAARAVKRFGGLHPFDAAAGAAPATGAVARLVALLDDLTGEDQLRVLRMRRGEERPRGAFERCLR